MTSKLMIATTVAVLSLATTAFAGEGGLPPVPGTNPGVVTGNFDNTTLPSNGSEGAVQSPNSLPPGFYNGTVQYRLAQARNRWFASEAARHHYAQAQQGAPRG